MSFLQRVKNQLSHEARWEICGRTSLEKKLHTLQPQGIADKLIVPLANELFAAQAAESHTSKRLQQLNGAQEHLRAFLHGLLTAMKARDHGQGSKRRSRQSTQPLLPHLLHHALGHLWVQLVRPAADLHQPSVGVALAVECMQQPKAHMSLPPASNCPHRRRAKANVWTLDNSSSHRSDQLSAVAGAQEHGHNACDSRSKDVDQ